MPYLTFIYCNLFRTSRTHSVWFLSLRDCYCNILLTYYLTYSMLLYLPLHYNEIKMVDRKRLELLFSTCKADVIPPILTAHLNFGVHRRYLTALLH